MKNILAMLTLAGLVTVATSAIYAADEPAMPSIKSAAPDFTLKSQEGKNVSLKDFRGKWVVLYFYPKDNTPGCTTEGQNFRDLHPQFQKLKCAVFGISRDITALRERERGSLEALLVNPAPRLSIATGKWIAGTLTGMLSVMISGTLLYALFKYIPLQELGIRFRIDSLRVTQFLITILPLCPFIVSVQMYVATFAKSFKEAQSYLSFLMMAQMIPGMMATMNTMSTKAWMHFVPWVGQQTLLTDIIGNKPISPVVFVVVGLLNLTLAFGVIRATAALDHRGRWGWWGLVAMLSFAYLASSFSAPPPNAQAIAVAGLGMWLFVAWAFWADRHRRPAAGA